MTDIDTIREALIDGLEYFGHELDDVTGRVHAVSDQAKKYDSALAALARVEAELAEAKAKIDRLTSRGIEDLRFSLEEAEARVVELTRLAWATVAANYDTSGGSIMEKQPLWDSLANLESALRGDSA